MAADFQGAGDDEILRQVNRFDRKIRRAVGEIAGFSKQHRDVLYSFPAAGFSIATQRGSVAERRDALVRIAKGAPLREVAQVLRLPYWTRKLPPEAFGAPLPEQLAPTLDDDGFGRQVVNHLPENARPMQNWLKWVVDARGVMGDEFALWVSSRRVFAGFTPSRKLLDPLMAYAWFSGSDGGVGAELLNDRWTPEMSLTTAALRAREWVLRIMLDHCRFGGVADTVWTQIGRSKGYRIDPLLTSKDLLAEGKGMSNCAASYQAEIAFGRRRLYGVRKRRKRIATFETLLFAGQAGVISLGDLRGPNNCAAGSDIREAVRLWLEERLSQPDANEQFHLVDGQAVPRWREVFEPFAKATGAHSDFTEFPGLPVMSNLTRDLEVLAEEEAFGRKLRIPRRRA